MFNLKSTARAEELSLEHLSERYHCQRAIFEAQHALAYDAEDLKTNRRVFVWTYRKALVPGMNQKVIEHVLKPAFSIPIPSPEVLALGTIGDVGLFYTTSQVAASPLLERATAESRKSLLAARIVRYLAFLHERKFVLGGLHSASFLGNRDGYIYFNGLLPIISGQQQQSETTGSFSSLIAPEVRSKGSLTASADVFALGAYLYQLLGGHDFPSHLDEQQLYQHLRTQLPLICTPERRLVWFLPLLEKMLQWRPERRYANAVELFEEVSHLCPDLGTFGAGSLKSIEAAAINYAMSPFTKAIVGTITLSLAIAVISHHVKLPEAVPAVTSSANLASIERANISGISNAFAPGAVELGPLVGGVFAEVKSGTEVTQELTPEIDVPLNTGIGYAPSYAAEAQQRQDKRIELKPNFKIKAARLPATRWSDDPRGALVQIITKGHLTTTVKHPECPRGTTR